MKLFRRGHDHDDRFDDDEFYGDDGDVEDGDYRAQYVDDELPYVGDDDDDDDDFSDHDAVARDVLGRGPPGHPGFDQRSIEDDVEDVEEREAVAPVDDRDSATFVDDDEDEYGEDDDDLYEDELDDDELPDRPGRRRVALVVVTVAVVAVAAVGILARHSISDAFTSSGRTPATLPIVVESTAIGTTTTALTESEAPVASSVVTTTVVAPTEPAAPATATTPATATAATNPSGPTSTATTAAPPAATGPAAAKAEVTTLQVVPAMRDIIVTINGKAYASDVDGTIALPLADRHGTLQVVGMNTNPPLEQVQFTGWGDGGTQVLRALDSVDGPVAQLGFNVSDHVQAVAGGVPFGQATINFSSPVGPLTMTVGQAAWVLKTRAIATPSGLIPDSIVYTAVSLTKAGVTTALSPLAFKPAPEANWVVVA